MSSWCSVNVVDAVRCTTGATVRPCSMMHAGPSWTTPTLSCTATDVMRPARLSPVWVSAGKHGCFYTQHLLSTIYWGNKHYCVKYWSLFKRPPSKPVSNNIHQASDRKKNHTKCHSKNSVLLKPMIHPTTKFSTNLLPTFMQVFWQINKHRSNHNLLCERKKKVHCGLSPSLLFSP